jgi:hypothetical protein
MATSNYTPISTTLTDVIKLRTGDIDFIISATANFARYRGDQA